MNYKINGILALIFLLSLFVQVNFSEFRKTVEVQVVSDENIPIENAYVYFTYQLNSIDGYITSRAIVTNNVGKANFTLYNNEFDPNKVDTKYTVTVIYGNLQEKKTFDINKTYSTQIIKLPVYLVSIYLIDDQGKPANAIIEFNGIRYSTDSYGVARLYLPKGVQTITILYKNLKKEEKIEVTQNARYSFRVYERKATIYIVNSLGKKIAGTIEYAGKKIIVPETGKEFVFGDENNPSIKVIVGDYEKTKYITFQPEVDILIPVDREKPNISNVKVEYDKNQTKVKVEARINDEGNYSSGLSDITLFYETEEKEGAIPMYLFSDKEIFVGVVNVPEETKFFSYTIIAKDKENNENSYSGNVNLLQIANNESTNNNTNQNNNNQPNQPNPGTGNQQQNNLVFIILGIVILAIAVYLIYTKTKSKESS
ncbi:MAG: hypothetical protein QW076_00870 [Candidatus Anstonellales archaeon]